MKRQKFINAENLPDLAQAFAQSASPALQHGDDLTVSLIGEPGVGKSYISAKLSEAVLGENITARVKSLPRENMHDLILWSTRENENLQIIQYDEASTRFVDSVYHDFVTQQHEQNPIPEREKPGITFAEHPEPETEAQSDMVIRLSFSDQQKTAIEMLKNSMFGADPEMVASIKDDIARVMAQGCLLEMEFQGDKVDHAPLIDFFDPPNLETSDSITVNARQDDEPEPEFV